MHSFIDRYDAGRQLVPLLKKYQDAENTLVLGLPRGGVLTAYEVAKGLHLPLDITCPRKIGAPFNEEFAIGAITETGERILDEETIEDLNISSAYIERMIEQEKAVAQKRLNVYRKGLPPRDFKNKTVIIVDDGLATGATMRTAIKTVKAEGAQKVIMAIPVAPPTTFQKLKGEVDEAYCLSLPPSFYAVGQFYINFRATEDEEVIRLLQEQIKEEE